MVSDALSLKSPSMERTMVSNTKLEVEKFDGTNNYSMCQCEVLGVLTQQELDIALVEKPIDIVEKDRAKINHQACGTIRLCLTKDQKYFIMKENLENKYMTKSIENRLYLKKNSSTSSIKQGLL